MGPIGWVRASVGVCVWGGKGGGGGKRIGEYRPLLEPVRSQKKVMASY